jgi:flavin reductase
VALNAGARVSMDDAWAPEAPAAFADAVGFRDAMACLASGVAVVACMDGNRPRGLLVSSMTSLSVEPPRMLFCVRKAAGSHDALVRARRCSLSVLSDAHADEAERFSTATPAADRFGSGAWRLEAGRPPVHSGAMIGLTGVISQRTDAGSHSVFFLDIETIEVMQPRAAGPLIYFGRAFRTLAPNSRRPE